MTYHSKGNFMPVLKNTRTDILAYFWAENPF